MTSIYVISAGGIKDRYKIGIHSGNIEKLKKRYITAIPDIKIHLFENCNYACDIEEKCHSDLFIHCIENINGNPSEWFNCSLEEILECVNKNIKLITSKTILLHINYMLHPVQKYYEKLDENIIITDEYVRNYYKYNYGIKFRDEITDEQFMNSDIMKEYVSKWGTFSFKFIPFKDITVSDFAEICDELNARLQDTYLVPIKTLSDEKIGYLGKTNGEGGFKCLKWPGYKRSERNHYKQIRFNFHHTKYDEKDTTRYWPEIESESIDALLKFKNNIVLYKGSQVIRETSSRNCEFFEISSCIHTFLDCSATKYESVRKKWNPDEVKIILDVFENMGLKVVFDIHFLKDNFLIKKQEYLNFCNSLSLKPKSNIILELVNA